LLLLTPVLWGATFPAGKIALSHLTVVPFMAWTRALGFLTIAALFPLLRGEDRPRPRDRSRARAVIGPGLLLGALIFAGYVLQTEGLARTSATNAAFITGLYVVFTPILAAALFRYRVPAAAWLAVAVAVVGLGLLSVRHLGTFRLHVGDLLVLAGAVAWAGHITAVGHFSPRFPAWMLSLAQMGFTAILQWLLAIPTGLHPHQALAANVWPLLLLTGVLGSGVAFTIQVVAQQGITPSRAVIILAGESLFAAAFSAAWIGERLATHQWIGAGLVLSAMAYSELSARRPRDALLEPASAP
jgi:drug/metabolite transporter (DMT)-like permease